MIIVAFYTLVMLALFFIPVFATLYVTLVSWWVGPLLLVWSRSVYLAGASYAKNAIFRLFTGSLVALPLIVLIDSLFTCATLGRVQGNSICQEMTDMLPSYDFGFWLRRLAISVVILFTSWLLGSLILRLWDWKYGRKIVSVSLLVVLAGATAVFAVLAPSLFSL